MNKIVVSVAALTMFATSSFAGSLVVPEMEPMVEVMQEDTGSSGGLIIPLLALVAIGLMIASNGNDTPRT